MDALADASPYFIVVGVLLAASAFFSGTEVAMFSLRRVDREQMARSKRRVDKLVHALVSRPRRLIATILIGNEIVNVSISSSMAAASDRIFAGRSELAVALLSTAMVLPLVLLLGEVTPKTVAIKTSTGWSRTAARPLWWFGIAVTPIRVVVRAIADVVLRPLGVRSSRAAASKAISEDEFRALVDAGSAEGEVDPRERRLIHRVFEFGDKTVAQVMVASERSFLPAYNLPSGRMRGP